MKRRASANEICASSDPYPAPLAGRRSVIGCGSRWDEIDRRDQLVRVLGSFRLLPGARCPATTTSGAASSGSGNHAGTGCRSPAAANLGAAHRLTVPQHPSVVITLDQAIELAKKNNPTLQAQRTQIMQNKEQEVTANLRPNPALSWDAEYLPIFDPHLFSSEYMDNTAEFDAGLGYLFERGQKRQHRLQAAKDFTSVTESQVLDAERDVVANTGQQFVAALLAKSNLRICRTIAEDLSADRGGQPGTAEGGRYQQV